MRPRQSRPRGGLLHNRFYQFLLILLLGTNPRIDPKIG
jgi:hypothetical protein